MKTLTFTTNEGRDGRKPQYFAVVEPDGKMHCSCGRELIKLDDKTYRCGAGWPLYRFDDGDIVIDKFGNLMMRTKDHD
jgi:hypothetical protein